MNHRPQYDWLNIFTSVMLLDVVLNNRLQSSIMFPMVCLF